jgi:hypothetical protein
MSRFPGNTHAISFIDQLICTPVHPASSKALLRHHSKWSVRRSRMQRRLLPGVVAGNKPDDASKKKLQARWHITWSPTGQIHARTLRNTLHISRDFEMAAQQPARPPFSFSSYAVRSIYLAHNYTTRSIDRYPDASDRVTDNKFLTRPDRDRSEPNPKLRPAWLAAGSLQALAQPACSLPQLTPTAGIQSSGRRAPMCAPPPCRPIRAVRPCPSPPAGEKVKARAAREAPLLFQPGPRQRFSGGFGSSLPIHASSHRPPLVQSSPVPVRAWAGRPATGGGLQGIQASNACKAASDAASTARVC